VIVELLKNKNKSLKRALMRDFGYAKPDTANKISGWLDFKAVMVPESAVVLPLRPALPS
jgi:hypothetical protein